MWRDEEERERERERERKGGRRAGEEREVSPLVLLRLFDSVAVAETTPLPTGKYSSSNLNRSLFLCLIRKKGSLSSVSTLEVR